MSRLGIALLALIGLTWLSVTVPGAERASADRFPVAATLSNGAVVPPAVPTTTIGGPRPASFGYARMIANDAFTFMTIKVTVFGIDLTGTQTVDVNDNMTAVQIRRADGVVVFGLFGVPSNDNNPNDLVVTPFATGVGGIISGKWDLPEGNNTVFLNGANVMDHFVVNTVQFPNGEIRGGPITSETQGPELAATKTNNVAGRTDTNRPWTWTIQAANVSPTHHAFYAVGSEVLHDELPAGLTYGAPTILNPVNLGNPGLLSCSIAANLLSCVVSGAPFGLAFGGHFDVQFTATAPISGFYVNSPVTLGCRMPAPLGDFGGGVTTVRSHTGCTDVVTVGFQDLAISKTHSGSFSRGQNGAIYTITVSNNGTAPTTGSVNVSDTLPTGLTLASMSGTGWNCFVANCGRSDPLAPGATYEPITVLVNVAGNAPSSVTNSATVSNVNEPLIKRGNETATDVTAIGQGDASLTLSKSGGTGALTPGANVTYVLTLMNNGPAIATSIVVSDPIPANTTFVSATGAPGVTIAAPAVGSGPPASVTFSSATMAAGTTVLFTVTVRINPTVAGGTTVQNLATAQGANTGSPVGATSQGTVPEGPTTQGGPTTPAATATPTLTPVVVPVAVRAPQVFQNPGAVLAVMGGATNGTHNNTPMPSRPAVVAPLVDPGVLVIRPPSTGDAGLLRAD